MGRYTEMLHGIVAELTGPGAPPVPKHQKEVLRLAAEIAGGLLDNVDRGANALELMAKTFRPKLAMDKPNEDASA
jgi:hypothetical protein